jgi:hypothetical protein
MLAAVRISNIIWNNRWLERRMFNSVKHSEDWQTFRRFALPHSLSPRWWRLSSQKAVIFILLSDLWKYSAPINVVKFSFRVSVYLTSYPFRALLKTRRGSGLFLHGSPQACWCHVGCCLTQDWLFWIGGPEMQQSVGYRRWCARSLTRSHPSGAALRIEDSALLTVRRMVRCVRETRPD